MLLGGEARHDDEEFGTNAAEVNWYALGRNVPNDTAIGDATAVVPRDGNVREASVAVAENSDRFTKWRLKLHWLSFRQDVRKRLTQSSASLSEVEEFAAAQC